MFGKKFLFFLTIWDCFIVFLAKVFIIVWYMNAKVAKLNSPLIEFVFKSLLGLFKGSSILCNLGWHRQHVWWMSEVHHSLLSYGWYSRNSRDPWTERWARSLPCPDEPPAHAQDFGGFKYVWLGLSSDNWTFFWILEEFLNQCGHFPLHLGGSWCVLKGTKHCLPLISVLHLPPWFRLPSEMVWWRGLIPKSENKTRTAVRDSWKCGRSRLLT